MTLSSYYGKIYGVVDVCDIHHFRYYCDKGPIRAISLSLAAISLDVVFTRFTDIHDGLQVEHGFTLWANGHLTIDIIESAQQLGMRFKFIGQQKDWAFTFDKWGHGVNDYVVSVLGMEPRSCLALCNKARQMAKNIVKRTVKGLSGSDIQPQLTKALGQQALLKEGHPPTPV